MAGKDLSHKRLRQHVRSSARVDGQKNPENAEWPGLRIFCRSAPLMSTSAAPFSTRPGPVKNETSSRCAYRRRGQDPSRTARAALCLASTSTRSASGCWRVMGIAFQVDQLVAATRSSGADGLADQWPSAREFPGLIPPVGQRCVVSLPDTTVAAPSTAGIRHGRRRAQAEAPLAE
jgi:hypothetical protein